MWRALIQKELQELAGWAAVSMLVIAYGFFSLTGIDPFSYQNPIEIPFYGEGAAGRLAVIGIPVAILLAFRQTVGESVQGTWLLLMHRAVSRNTVIAAKLIVGLLLTLLVALLPMLAFAWWAATPGTHASPFYWSMTLQAWFAWLGLSGIYLSAFLSGLRQAAWLGSRLLPLWAVVVIYCVSAGLIQTLAWPWLVLMMLAVDCVLLAAISEVTVRREFAS